MTFPLLRRILRGTLLGWLALIPIASSSRMAAADAVPPVRIPLWPDKAPDGLGGWTNDPRAAITVHRAAQPNGRAVVICPGGGYTGLMMEPEGHGIARWLNSNGITGVVLEYRMPIGGRPLIPLSDAQRALRTVRAHAAEWRIDPHKVGIMGFSAGGHLAATASTRFETGLPEATDPVGRMESRPDFSLLIYPMITMTPIMHASLRQNLLGPTPTAESIRLYSCELQVSKRTPPAFLAHAVDDTVVTPENSRLYHQALQAQGIPTRLLELPDGGHGLHGYRGPSWDAWQRESIAWMKAL